MTTYKLTRAKQGFLSVPGRFWSGFIFAVWARFSEIVSLMVSWTDVVLWYCGTVVRTVASTRALLQVLVNHTVNRLAVTRHFLMLHLKRPVLKRPVVS